MCMASRLSRLPEPQIVAGELADRGTAHQLHAPLDLASHEAERPLDTRLTGRRQGEEIEASEAHRLGAERKGFQNMRPALSPSIHHHVYSIADRVHDFSQLIKGRSRAIQLPPAMIGQYDARAADLSCAFRIRYGHDAVQTNMSVPISHHLSHVAHVH